MCFNSILLNLNTTRWLVKSNNIFGLVRVHSQVGIFEINWSISVIQMSALFGRGRIKMREL